ncbi:MAG: sirohydrochlorin chelatase [Oscillatoriales cyanobacterium]|uniref:Sirohydrochlorin chelatase n=1 Tax=Microcoleus anatoxicus PTRS2 TaxID=2705321 RepID=A0ABU8YRI1_9CYAN|nr:MAG: sirohydrochlorin chelatase [Oscillatoriales cyanobacterium]TAE01443.1 MAG: sirohydrochlorin chelatase [Oscillatoriales cyanobacterium]TAE03862.1 MAG: sirohydrochlorin chelatase [Oscillatoriales cyanobacterium]TAF45687.1 MAG: sirohydrochlorin chelatase [Oscillatoriales cyanobacterium]TAF70998.1 MAG: sirohydrochlorin chelatase [Oscillatoriales cyanobacterium]
MRSTYLLVSHGSRDPRPQVALENLAQLLSQKLPTLGNSGASGVPTVGTATLELGPAPLHEQICHFAEHTLSLGLTEVQILPIFLLPGVHVAEDIPAEVEIAQKTLSPKLKIELLPHLGTQEAGLAKLVKTQMQEVAFLPNLQLPKWILLSHGSRRLGGNSTVEEIASKVGAHPAYWSVKPSLEERIDSLVRDGQQQIGIVPYFLFNGGITDAIAQKVEQLKQQFPTAELHLANPLGVSVELADLIGELIQK